MSFDLGLHFSFDLDFHFSFDPGCWWLCVICFIKLICMKVLNVNLYVVCKILFVECYLLIVWYGLRNLQITLFYFAHCMLSVAFMTVFANCHFSSNCEGDFSLHKSYIIQFLCDFLEHSIKLSIFVLKIPSLQKY